MRISVQFVLWGGLVGCSTSSPNTDGGADASVLDAPFVDASDVDAADASPGCETVATWWQRSGSSAVQQCSACLSSAENNQPCVGLSTPPKGCDAFNICINNKC